MPLLLAFMSALTYWVPVTRSERMKLDDDLVEVNGKVDEISSETGEAAIQKLQDEIKDCKGILKCGVCFDRPKEVCYYNQSYLWLYSLYNHVSIYI